MAPKIMKLEFKCGQCKWLDTKYKGANCRQAKAKEEDSSICSSFELKEDLVLEDEMEKPKITTVDSIRNLDYIKKIINKVSDPRLFVDVSLITELKDFKIIRTTDFDGKQVKHIPKDPGNTEALCIIASLIEEVQAKRERITEIKIGMLQLKKEYDKLWKLTDSFLKQNYATLINSKKREDRTAFIAEIIPEVDNKLDEIEEIQVIADLVDNQLNGTHFSLKEISNIGQAILNKKSIPYYSGV